MFKMKDLNKQISEWLTVDVEEAQKIAVSKSPVFQRRLIDASLEKVLQDEVKGREASKLLEICQTMLSASFPFYSEPEILIRLNKILHYSISGINSELKERAVAIAGSLLGRMRNGRSSLPPMIKGLISKALEDANPVSSSVLKTMLLRIEKSETKVNNYLIKNPFSIDFKSIDIKRAAATVSDDVKGDWYRDPWGWPEVKWLAESRPEKVVERLRNHEYGWTTAIDVPKKNGAVRPGIVINPLDRLAFQCLADELSVEAAGDLPSWVHGWRLKRSSPRRGDYASNHDEWKLFSEKLKAGTSYFRFSAHLDIQSFFKSVDTNLLLAQLGRRYRNAPILDKLEGYFTTWQNQPNGSGIPQRSFASSVLIHTLLRPIDIHLDKLCKSMRSGTFAASRWMDDIWIHCDNEKSLRKYVAEIEEILGLLRLSLNAEKTEILQGSDSSDIILIDDYESDDESETLDQLLFDDEDAPSPIVNHKITMLIQERKFDWFDSFKPHEFSEIAHRGNQLARAFRISGNWKRLTETYLSYAKQHVSGENLSVAGWGEMFPNKPMQVDKGFREIHKYFVDQIFDNAQRLLTPLAAQRISAWGGIFKENVLSDGKALEKAASSCDIFRLRGLSYATLGGSFRKEKITAILDEVGDDFTRDFLTDRNFSPPPLSEKFQSE